MSFVEIVSLPNYYIHEIYKQFVEDSIARAKKEEAERKEQERENRKNSSSRFRDTEQVQNLRQALSGFGEGSNDDLEELVDELM